MIVISDTTAITSLMQVGQIELLAKLYREVLIPHAVETELRQAHSVLPNFLRSVAVKDTEGVKRLKNLLDVGEAEAIILAKEQQAQLLLIDDAEGRRVALAEGINIIGLLGVLVTAKREGLLRSVRALTADLERIADFRVSDEVKNIIFRKAGEEQL